MQYKAICPADGWFAVFLENSPPWVDLLPVAVWAIRGDSDDEGPFDSVQGLLGGDYLESAEDCRGFYVFAHHSNVSKWKNGWIEEAKRRQASKEADKTAQKGV